MTPAGCDGPLLAVTVPAGCDGPLPAVAAGCWELMMQGPAILAPLACYCWYQSALQRAQAELPSQGKRNGIVAVIEAPIDRLLPMSLHLKRPLMTIISALNDEHI